MTLNNTTTWTQNALSHKKEQEEITAETTTTNKTSALDDQQEPNWFDDPAMQQHPQEQTLEHTQLNPPVKSLCCKWPLHIQLSMWQPCSVVVLPFLGI